VDHQWVQVDGRGQSVGVGVVEHGPAGGRGRRSARGAPAAADERMEAPPTELSWRPGPWPPTSTPCCVVSRSDRAANLSRRPHQMPAGGPLRRGSGGGGGGGGGSFGGEGGGWGGGGSVAGDRGRRGRTGRGRTHTIGTNHANRDPDGPRNATRVTAAFSLAALRPAPAPTAFLNRRSYRAVHTAWSADYASRTRARARRIRGGRVPKSKVRRRTLHAPSGACLRPFGVIVAPGIRPVRPGYPVVMVGVLIVGLAGSRCTTSPVPRWPS